MLSNIVNGSRLATGANIDITLGFIPSQVIVVNITAATFPELRWLSSMPNASAIKRVTSTFTMITTLGITPLGAGASDTVQGFRIGADAAVNNSGDTIHWFAFRNGPGSGA
jgi:hypothetical protein